jgi:thiol:disulfide interchange protein DsbD
MGAPLLALGLSAGTLLPKSGPWMENVKKAFGVVLLASALWIVSPVLPVAWQMAGWAALLIVPAVFLNAIDPLPPHVRGWPRFWKGVGIVMLVTGAAMLIGALSGSGDPLRPLSATAGAKPASERSALRFERVTSIAELDTRLNSPGKPVMRDFYADWCVTCKEMERDTFSDQRVQRALKDWVVLQADVTANSETDKALLARFNLFGPPGIVFFDAAGNERRGVRVIGFQNADRFLSSLQAATAPVPGIRLSER